MKLEKLLLENEVGMKLGELIIDRRIIAPRGVRREKWEGNLTVSGYEQLTSLEGAPIEVGRDFWCDSNKQLTSLEGGPTKVGRDFFCTCNERLTSLEGGPTLVDGAFDCHSNQKLASLKGAPAKVDGDFLCRNNARLTSLKGMSTEVGGNFECNSNDRLASLEGGPTKVGGNFNCFHNKRLTSLENIHKYVHEIDGQASFYQSPIKSHVLGLLKIKKLKEVELDNKEVEAIINKYLPEGDILDCQEELIDAGYEEYAKL